jgi:hypothetical protein
MSTTTIAAPDGQRFNVIDGDNVVVFGPAAHEVTWSIDEAKALAAALTAAAKASAK